MSVHKGWWHAEGICDSACPECTATKCPDCQSQDLSGPDYEGFYDCHTCGAAWLQATT